jgi:drug/metabolite transporter superfamily protein YnfA
MNELFVGFALADVTAAVLAILDWRSQRRVNVFLPVLIALVVYQLFTCVAHRIELWRAFSEWYIGM